MAEQQLPDINIQINELPFDKETKDKLFYAFYDENPRKAFESIKGVPLNIKQAMFDIRGRIHRGEKYDIDDIVRAVPVEQRKPLSLTDETVVGTEKTGAIPSVKPKIPKVEEVESESIAKRAALIALGPAFSMTKSEEAKPEYKQKEPVVPVSKKETKTAPAPATAPPPVVVESKKVEPPAPLLSREEMESRYANYIKEQAEKAGKEARPKTAEPPKAAVPTEESWFEQAKKKVAGFVSGLTEGDKPKMPASPKLAQAKAVIEQVDKPILSTDIKDYSIGAGLAEKYPNLFVPISKQVDPTSLSATDTYEAWKEIGANLMSRALGVPVSKVKTDISNIVGAQFLDEAAKTAPELFDFMSSPGGLGYLAAGVTTGKVRQLKQLYNAMTATDLGAMFSEEMKRAVDDPTERNIAKAAKALGFLVLGVKDQIKPVERVPKPTKKPTPGLEPPTVEAEFEVVGKEAPKTEGKPGVIETKPAIAATEEVAVVKEPPSLVAPEPGPPPVVRPKVLPAVEQKPEVQPPLEQEKPSASLEDQLAAEKEGEVLSEPQPPAQPPSIAPQGVTAPPPAPVATVTHPKLTSAGEPVVISKPSTPTPDTTWEDASKTAVFTPTGNAPVSIGKVEVKSWNPPQEGWSKIPGTKESLDVRKPFEPIAGKKTGAGVIVVEDDGRIWLISPTNEFGGYKNTFPKGTVDPNLTMQENAIKEAWEETGLKVDIIGVLGDYERGTSKARYYIATRSGGSPKDMGWEAQAVNLATIADAKSLLNQQVDQKILTDLENMISSGKLGEIKDGTPRKLSSYGPEKAPKTQGSNPGGWYGDQPGDKWLVKGNKQKQLGTVTPEQSDNRASNEVLASEFIRSVIPTGAPKMKLVDLEGKYGGGLGVASKAAANLTQFDKNNPDHLSAAQKTFALHAWLANYDVLGMGYDNTFITPDGNAINIDPGGALLFRAQGLPKGASHGVTNGLLNPSAPEFESMRTTTPEQKAVFGKMTQEQLKQSAEMLEKVTDEQIKKLVNTYGWGTDAEKAALTDNLIKRRDAILGKVGLTAATQPTAISTVQPPTTPAPPAVAPISPPPGQMLPSWQIQTPSAAPVASQPTPVQMGTINSSQYAIQASVPKSVARAWNSTDFSQYEFHDNIVGIMDSIYADMLSGSSPQMALQDAINSAQISAGDEGLNDAKKNAWDKGIIPYLEYLSNKIQGKSSAEVKDILNNEGKSLGMVDDWQSTAESFAASLSQWVPEPPQTAPSTATTTAPPPAPAVATQPPPQSATGVTQASPTGTAVIDFPQQNVNAVVPVSVYQAFNTPDFNKQNFFFSSMQGVKSIYADLTYGYSFDIAIDNAISNASYASTFAPNDPSVQKTYQEGVIPYFEYLKQKLQGKSNQEIGEELKKEAQSFGSNNWWVNAYGPVAPSAPTSTQTPPSPAVATQPPPTAQAPVQPTSGSQIAAAAASSFLAGNPGNVSTLDVGNYSFLIPEFVMQSYQQQDPGNQNSFNKNIEEVWLSAQPGGAGIANKLSSLISLAQAKLADYKNKIANGTASQFDKERAKYYEDLMIPYLEYLETTGTVPIKNAQQSTPVISSAYVITPSYGSPNQPLWSQQLEAAGVPIPSIKGGPKKVIDPQTALAFFGYNVSIYGDNSPKAKKALKLLNAKNKNGVISQTAIDAFLQSAQSAYGPLKNFLNNIDAPYVDVMDKYIGMKDTFKYPWDSGSSLADPSLKSKFSAFQTKQINKILKGNGSPTQEQNDMYYALQSYTGGWHNTANKAIADLVINGTPIPQSIKSKIALVDKAIGQIKLGHDLLLNRSIASKYLFSYFGLNTNPSQSEISSLIGRKYKELGIVSASMKPTWKTSYQDTSEGQLDFVIKAGAEFCGVRSHSLSNHPSEAEVTLPRGTTYIIEDIKKIGPKKWEAQVSIVAQTQEPL